MIKLYVIGLLSAVVWTSNFGTTFCVFQAWATKWIYAGYWEPGFSLLGKVVTNMERGKVNITKGDKIYHVPPDMRIHHHFFGIPAKNS